MPYPLKVWWFFCAPIALPFAVRIAWEKTVWMWSRGPQMVGFSLMHIHPRARDHRFIRFSGSYAVAIAGDTRFHCAAVCGWHR